MRSYWKGTFFILAALFVIFVGLAFYRERSEAPTITPPAGRGGLGTVPAPDGREQAYKDLIRIDTPRPESTVSSPLTIRGVARGPWFFEASFPVILTDWDGRIIAEGSARAEGEWMTTEYVPFTAELVFVPDTRVSDRGALILRRSNPSGLPEHEEAFEITVFFAR
jgi:hypothetical protein